MRGCLTPEATDVTAAERDDRLAARAEAKAAFHLRMRARGIRDLDVLRAFELVPRDFFVPPRYIDLATRDLPLPIDCGQTLLEPWLVARMIEALTIDPTHRVLEIGSGSGYATAILASLGADVIGIERFQSLATAARARLANLDIANAVIAWGDGLAIPAAVERFDRIIVHGLLPDDLGGLIERLGPKGVLVCGRADGVRQIIARVATDSNGALSETVVCACRLQALIPGVAAAL